MNRREPDNSYQPEAATEQDQSDDLDSLPLPEHKFGGHIGRTVDESIADHPRARKAPKGAPNVVLVLLDDVGFGHPSTFGGPVEMPTLDGLAKCGLKYTRMHTTALCTPTRASLLTGRNHHAVSSGIITDWSTGFPGYTSIWPRSSACIAEILKQHGYSTAALGKWHNTPKWEVGPTGPFERWPTGVGFEYFYGFHGSDTSQFEPALVEGTRHIDPPRTPDEGYHLDEDLADRAIQWVRMQKSAASARPFFLYWAPGTSHAPHHAPKEWLEKYRGKFDHGWDKQREITFARQRELGIIPEPTQLTPRPAEIPAWDELPDDEKLLGCRLQEAQAAALSHCDYQIGRFVEELKRLNLFDDTLFIFLAGDNGPAGEGTLQGQTIKSASTNGFPESVASQLSRLETIGGSAANNNYPAGWAWAGSAPMQWLKQVASHFGGTRNGLVVSWPKKFAERNEVREQFHHCIDIAPTILELAGIPKPRSVNGVQQAPLDGVSMAYSFSQPGTASTRRIQYFETIGNRAIYCDGWVASARHLARLPWQYGYAPRAPFDKDVWELYHVDSDFSQSNNLADKYPEKLQQLIELWWSEAGKNNVLPLDDRLGERLRNSGRPDPLKDATVLVLYDGVRGVPEEGVPNLKGRSHRISARVVIPEGGVEGVLIAQGGRFGGYSLYMTRNRLIYVHNFVGLERYRVVSEPLTHVGACKLTMEFDTDEAKPGSGGSVTLLAEDNVIGQGTIKRTVAFLYSTSEGASVGLDTGSAVDTAYDCPFRFTGILHDVAIEVLSGVNEEEQAQERRRIAKALADEA